MIRQLRFTCSAHMEGEECGPFDLDLYGEIKADGTLDFAEVTLEGSQYPEGYTFAFTGVWIVRCEDGAMYAPEDWGLKKKEPK